MAFYPHQLLLKCSTHAYMWTKTLKTTCGHNSKTSPDWTKPIWFLGSAHQIRPKSAKKKRSQQICCWPVKPDKKVQLKKMQGYIENIIKIVIKHLEINQIDTCWVVQLLKVPSMGKINLSEYYWYSYYRTVCKFCPVDWGCRIHQLHLCRGVRHL